MTERKANANTGVLRFAQDDGEKQTTATAKAKAKAPAGLCEAKISPGGALGVVAEGQVDEGFFFEGVGLGAAGGGRGRGGALDA